MGMMDQVRALVGMSKNADDGETRLRSSWYADLMVSELNPKWFEWAARGFLFIYPTAAAGVTFAVAGNNLPTIWNPNGSNKLFVPLRVILGYVSGTHAAGHVAWASQNNVGSAIGTAAPLSVFTDITPVNGIIGLGKKSAMRFASTCTFTTAPTYLRPAGLSTAAMVATSTVAPFPMTTDEDGSIILAPGAALQLCASAAIVMVASVAIIGLELPIPPGYDITG